MVWSFIARAIVQIRYKSVVGAVECEKKNV